MRRWLRAGIGATAVAAIAGACGTTRSGADAAAAPVGERRADRVTVRVDNRHALDVIVYALDGRASHRLGVVTRRSDATLAVPAALPVHVAGVQLYADLIGSRDGFMTTPIVAHPGDEIVLTVESTVERSSFGVWPRAAIARGHAGR